MVKFLGEVSARIIKDESRTGAYPVRARLELQFVRHTERRADNAPRQTEVGMVLRAYQQRGIGLDAVDKAQTP